MTAPTPAVCPECGGATVPGRDLLLIGHVDPCSIRAAEDATGAADADRARATMARQFTRPSTTAEQLLLAAAGYPAAPTTTVSYPFNGAGVRVRAWPGVPCAVHPS